MDVFAQRHQQAELIVNRLKQELIALNRIADNQQKIKEKREIERIRVENNNLLQNINNLKVQLQYYEAQNGVKHVAIPVFKAKNGTSPESVSNAAELPEEKPTPVTNNTEEKKQKSKKENKKKEKSAAGNKQAAGNEQKPVDISRLCLKVGKIVEAKKHPDADGLLVETVDFGEERGPRTICSGLVAHYQPEQISGRMAVFACNLKSVKMRGIASEGMIMCASTPEKVEIMDVPQGAVIGDRIVSADYPGEADDVLNPKKKVWENIQPDLLVNGEGLATYKGSTLHVAGKGNWTALTMRNCPIK